jgi:hypothetical protein
MARIEGILNDDGRSLASLANFERIGSRKDSVFPEPVPVVTTRLRPSLITPSIASA